MLLLGMGAFRSGPRAGGGWRPRSRYSVRGARAGKGPRGGGIASRDGVSDDAWALITRSWRARADALDRPLVGARRRAISRSATARRGRCSKASTGRRSFFLSPQAPLAAIAFVVLLAAGPRAASRRRPTRSDHLRRHLSIGAIGASAGCWAMQPGARTRAQKKGRGRSPPAGGVRPPPPRGRYFRRGWRAVAASLCRQRADGDAALRPRIRHPGGDAAADAGRRQNLDRGRHRPPAPRPDRKRHAEQQHRLRP